MITTGIYRQVPIKHRFPTFFNDGSSGFDLHEVITGYYFEEAWCLNPETYFFDAIGRQLRAGQEVEGFVWKRVGEPG